MKYAFIALASLFILNACALMKILQTPTANYENYLHRHVIEEKQYSSGRLLLGVKLLPMNSEVIELQKKLSESFVRSLKADRDEYVFAISGTEIPNLEMNQMRAKILGREEFLEMSEIRDDAMIQAFYPYAYPYARVFWGSFEHKASGEEKEASLRIEVPGAHVDMKVPLPSVPKL